MALGLSCDSCNKFIKNVTADEAIKIGNNNICKECRDNAYKFIDEINSFKKSALQRISGYCDKEILKAEEIKNRWVGE